MPFQRFRVEKLAHCSYAVVCQRAGENGKRPPVSAE